MAPVTYPDPASPEGQAWAAAGFPVGADGAPEVPAVPPKDPPAAGTLARYTFHDDYSEPPGPRTQVVLVIATEPDGKVRGFPLGFEDQAAAFAPEQLD